MSEPKRKASPQHSPLPWTLFLPWRCHVLPSDGEGGSWSIRDRRDIYIAKYLPREIAEFVVQAVNSHERLTAAHAVAVEMAENVTRLNYELATSGHKQGGTITVSHRWAGNIAILARKFQEMNREQD